MDARRDVLHDVSRLPNPFGQGGTMTTTHTTLPTCEWEHCPGHLGKFQSCRDEALFELSLDGFYDSTGDVEFEGHFTLITLDDPAEVEMFGHDGGPTFTVEPGTYIVESTNSGAVYVSDTDPDYLHCFFRGADQRYSQWLDPEED
jgi:hypothetical protein